jgi:hypothetical protein
MTFPFSFGGRLAGKIQIDPWQGEDLFIRGMAYDLRDQHARNVVIDGNTVQFDGNWFGYPFKLNMVRGITNGEISVESSEQQLLVTYRVNLAGTFFFITLAFFAFLALAQRDEFDSLLKTAAVWIILNTSLWLFTKFAFHLWVKWRLSEVQLKKPMRSS